MTRIAIIVGTKGRGSNMRAIIEACRMGRLSATVVVVISPKPYTPAVDAAEALGAKVEVLENFEENLGRTLSENSVDLVCLAGYMRLIPPDVVGEYEGRMLNIHPALLPKFGGNVGNESARSCASCGRNGVRLHCAFRQRTIRRRRHPSPTQVPGNGRRHARISRGESSQIGAPLLRGSD